MATGGWQRSERRLRGEIEARLAAARRPTRPRTRGWGRPCEPTSCRRSGAAGKTVWRAIQWAAKSRLEAQQRAAADARGRQPDQDRNPKGGQPYTRSYGEPDAKAQSNVTDPESGIMKPSNDGFQQCDNAQVAVDGAHQLVVATEVTANASDQGGVPALLDALAETVGEQPETVLADAGWAQRAGLAPGQREASTGMCPRAFEQKALQA